MKILFTNDALVSRGGSESYLETAAHALRGLGHDVLVYSPTCGAFADQLRAAGFPTTDDVGELPDDVDVLHGQHLTATARLRERFPELPLVFASHSWFVPIENPIPELRAGAFLAFNDLTERRLRASASAAGIPVHRLRQPIGISFADGARIPIGDRPQRVLAVSRRMNQVARDLERACSERGLAFDVVGRRRESDDPRREMLEADIVVAMGRTALEAMALGRAVLVLDESVVGGWITPESYERLEADGFTGLAGGLLTGDVGALLDGYSSDWGTTARRLAVHRHAAQLHAAELVEIYRSVAAAPVGTTSTSGVAHLAAERSHWEARAISAEWEVARLRRELADLSRVARWLRRPVGVAARAARKLLRRG